MHILYLDESGSAPNPTETYYVLGGVCVPENSIRWLSNKMEQLANDIDSVNSKEIEFHASEIYSGRSSCWEDKSRPERIEIIRRVLHILDSANPNIKVFACAIHKPSFPAEDIVMKAFEDISSRFDLYLRNLSTTSSEKQLGAIIIDKSSYENSFQKLILRFRNEGNTWGNQLRNLCEVPLFIDSKASRIVQLADHVAYAVFRRYNAEDLQYFNCIEGRFYQQNGVFHGLCHRQTINYSCSCPACATRRR